MQGSATVRQALELTIGLKLELELATPNRTPAPAPGEVFARVRPPGPGTSWSAPLQLRLLAPLPSTQSPAQASAPQPSPQLPGAATSTSTPPPQPNAAPLPTRPTAEVIALRPIPTLRLLPAQPPPAPLAPPSATLANSETMTRDWLTQQVRLHLPQARALAETLTEWSRRLTTQEAIGTAQPKGQTPAPSTAAVPLNDRLERLISRLPGPSTLTEPGGLQRAVEGSGIWLEARLAQLALTPGALTDASLGEDLKAQLLQFADQIRRHNRDAADTTARTATPAVINAGKALEHETEGMLKQLVSLQLQPLEQEAEQPRWVLDLPYRHSGGVGTVQAEIERERRQGEVEEAGWTIRLRLDLAELGPLSIRLTLKGQRLSASLLAERAPTAALLRSRLPLLREQLEARELEVTALHAGQGQTANPTRHPGPLISEQA